MVTLTNPARYETTKTVCEAKSEPELRSSFEKCPQRILIADHRDEVFARLAADLRQMGHTVFRASRAGDVCRVYSYGQIDLVLYNYNLPCESVWLNSMKLRMFDAYVRLWLYIPWKAAFEQQWANLSRIERVIYYRGDLFYLADQINNELQQLPLGGGFPVARDFLGCFKRTNEEVL